MRSAVLVIAAASLLGGLAPVDGADPPPDGPTPSSDSAPALTTLRPALPPAPPPLATFHTIDGTFNSGFYTDLVVDERGHPVVSYYDDTSSALVLARCLDPACNDVATRTLDDTGHTGLSTSLVLDADRPVVSYFDLSERRVRIAHCADPDCREVSLATLDADTPQLTGTAIGRTTDGRTHVAYRGGPAGQLRLATCQDRRCGNVGIRELDGPDVDEDIAMLVGPDGRITILYRRGESFRLITCRTARCDAATRTTVDEGPGAGFYPAVVADGDGLPVLAHLDFADKEVVLVRCRDAGCVRRDRTVVEAAPLSGFFADLALDEGGRARLAFFDEADETLVLVSCADVDCRTLQRATVDASPVAGLHLALAVAGDVPVIAYHAGVGRELRVVRCAVEVCAHPPETRQPGIGIDAAAGPDGHVVVVYRAPQRNLVRVVRCMDVDCREALLTSADDRADAAGSPAVAIGVAGLPVVAFQALAERDLRVSGCSTERCPFLESRDVVTAGSVGHSPDVIAAGGGETLLLHRDETRGRLELLRCSDQRCRAPAHLTVARTSSTGGAAAATPLADGSVAVAFHDDRDGRIQVAECSVSGCGGHVTLARGSLPAPLALAVRPGPDGDEVAVAHRDAATRETVLQLCLLPCDRVHTIHLPVGAAFPSVAATGDGFDVVHADRDGTTVLRSCDGSGCRDARVVGPVAGPTTAVATAGGTLVAVLDLGTGAPLLARCDRDTCVRVDPRILPQR